MNIVSNEKLIKRNAKIGQWSGLAGLIVLVGGMVVLFQSGTNTALYSLVWVAILIGFILSQVGIYFTNRWGRSPRPDEAISAALKGMPDSYTLYHYTTPISHLLVGPAGVWSILPRYQRGKITYDKGRYQQRGGGLMLQYLKIFGQEGLGRPEIEAQAEKEATEKYIKKLLPDQEIPDVQVALLFTNPAAEVDVDPEISPYPTMPSKDFKDYIRKYVKKTRLSPEKAAYIKQAIDESIAQ